MTEPRKPAARKPAARKKATTPRKPRATASKKLEADVAEVTLEEKQKQIEAYYVLQQAGVTIPEPLKSTAEAYITELGATLRDQQEAAEKQAQLQQERYQEQIAQANLQGPTYVRNRNHTSFSLRLERQTERVRIELKPRGMPGDMHEIKEEDLGDPKLNLNLNLGMIEIIPFGEAREVMHNQTHNMAPRVHTPTAILLNENGKPYADGAVKTEVEFNQQGVTVATVDPRVLSGHMTDRQLQNSLQRVQPGQPQVNQAPPVPERASQFYPTGGNQAIVQYGAPNLQSIQADIANRAVGAKEQNFHPGPDQLTVSVAPTERN